MHTCHVIEKAKYEGEPLFKKGDYDGCLDIYKNVIIVIAACGADGGAWSNAMNNTYDALETSLEKCEYCEYIMNQIVRALGSS
jgi:hypothetical protein